MKYNDIFTQTVDVEVFFFTLPLFIVGLSLTAFCKNHQISWIFGLSCLSLTPRLLLLLDKIIYMSYI